MMKRLLWLCTVVSLVAGFQGCNTGNNKDSGSHQQEGQPDLVVKELIDTIRFDLSNDDTCFISFNVDAPISGPEILVDSVLVFLNSELYEMFGTYLPFDTETFSEGDMLTKDGGRLLSNYTEKFSEPLKSPYGYAYQCIELKLEAQAEKYVTYGLKMFGHNGMHYTSEKFYYTFDKRDGHRVRDLISHENLARFSKENPGYDPELSNGPKENCCGLLGDSVVFVFPFYSGTTESTESVACSKIVPYLSPEVQKLL